ncbi:MAG TPA: SIS domain-containing protein [Propionibacteriaceae bacterium]|nr:SIS domain-containing protein [Propionibacteriaceae bacterium]
MTSAEQFHQEVASRLPLLVASAADGPIARAADLMADAIADGGVVHAFGTGHSEAFAMEVAGRAGGLIPTSKAALRDVVIWGSRERSALSGPELERDPKVAQELFDLQSDHPADVWVIASNSGVNGSIVGVAQAVKDAGHPLIAVTSLTHTMAVQPKHPSGKRLSDLADVVIDNLAPFGDTTVPLDAGDLTEGMVGGAISSITGAFIAQLLTLGTAERLAARGVRPPMYISANIPGGDEHNRELTDKYAGRLRIEG